MATNLQKLAAFERARKLIESSIVSEEAKAKLSAELAAQIAAFDAELAKAPAAPQPGATGASARRP